MTAECLQLVDLEKPFLIRLWCARRGWFQPNRSSIPPAPAEYNLQMSMKYGQLLTHFFPSATAALCAFSFCFSSDYIRTSTQIAEVGQVRCIDRSILSSPSPDWCSFPNPAAKGDNVWCWALFVVMWVSQRGSSSSSSSNNFIRLNIEKKAEESRFISSRLLHGRLAVLFLFRLLPSQQQQQRQSKGLKSRKQQTKPLNS